MSTPTQDRPWRRPGALTYARSRARSALRPAVTVDVLPPDVVTERDVAVVLRDGVTLRLNVFRPATAGPCPVILSAHPYGKDAVPRRTRRGWRLNPQFRIMNQPEPVRISNWTSWEAPDPAWWVLQGYAVVNLDTRGGGHSEGRGSLLSDQEADDIAQVIDWAATQEWSTGRIGMLGVSYLALSQYKVAALHPPALRAICPWEGFTDAYRDFFTPGGVVEDGFSRVWLTLTRHAARLSTDLAQERGHHLEHDDWWQALTPDLSRITVPMLVCASLSDANLHSVGSMRAFQAAAAPDKHVYVHRAAKWAAFYGEDGRRAQLAFFDRHLKELDVAPLPRVRLEVRDRADHVVAVRAEDDWPLPSTVWRRLHLGPDGRMGEAPPPDGHVHLDLRRHAAAFEYRFAEDTEITGPMTLRLRVSVTGTSDPRLFVGIEKRSNDAPVFFNGSYGYGRDHVAQGRLRLALRELDPTRGSIHEPEHTFRTPRPLHDGQEVDVVIPLSPSATLFHTGESMRLLVAGRYLHPRNPFFGHFPTHYQRSPRGRATLHLGPTAPSTLEIPVIPQS